MATISNAYRTAPGSFDNNQPKVEYFNAPKNDARLANATVLIREGIRLLPFRLPFKMQ